MEKEPVLTHTSLVRTCLLPVPTLKFSKPKYKMSKEDLTSNQLKTFLAVLRDKYVATKEKNIANTVCAYLHCTKCYIFNSKLTFVWIEQSLSISTDVIISSLTTITRN